MTFKDWAEKYSVNPEESRVKVKAMMKLNLSECESKQEDEA
jgi:hypothetical protein